MILENKVALVTGSARRIGAASVTALHSAGANVVVHYHQSEKDAIELISELNAKRAMPPVSIQPPLAK